MSRRLRRLALSGPAGSLEALLAWPAESPRGAALVCHPHPEHGGSMHTRAVHHLAGALADEALAVLRFNFRGVGQSAGRFDAGRGELADARAALRWLLDELPVLPVCLAGFSFGAYIALQLAADSPRVRALVAAGPPLALYDFGFLEGTTQPLLCVAGDRDPVCPIGALEQLKARLGPRMETALIPDSGHLLSEDLPGLRAAVRRFVTRAVAPPAP